MNYFSDINWAFNFNLSFVIVDPLGSVDPILCIQNKTEIDGPNNKCLKQDKNSAGYENQRLKSYWLEYALQNNLIRENRIDQQIQQFKVYSKQTKDQNLLSKSNEITTQKQVGQTKNSQQFEKETKWTAKQQQKLQELVGLYGKKWKQISLQLQNKTIKQIRYHYKKFLKKDKNQDWSEEQEFQIIRLVNEFGRSWVKISKQMKYRSATNVKNRFYGYILKNQKYINMIHKDNSEHYKLQKQQLTLI